MCLKNVCDLGETMPRRITSIYQPTNAYIISYRTHLKHFKPLRHVSILSDHHQGASFLAKVILRYSQFNSYLQTMYCGSISCCVGMCCGVVARCASYDLMPTYFDSFYGAWIEVFFLSTFFFFFISIYFLAKIYFA